MHDGCGAENGSKNVVEIVRNAAGEISDAVDLLRLHNFFFKLLFLGDVADNAPHQHGDMFIIIDK